MRKIFLSYSGFAALALAIVTLPSCLKSNDSTFTDFSTAGQTVSLLNSGLGNFRASNVSPYVGDSTVIDLTVQLNGEFAANDVTNVVLEIDDTKRVAYNGTQSIQFSPMTAAMYKIGNTNLVIDAGKRLAKTTVTVYSNPIKALPPSASFMLPINVKSASGKLIASNFQTMYINVIGNPLAGQYTHRYRRFQVADTTGTPLQDITNTVIITPVSPTEILSPETYTTTFVDANGGIIVSFKNAAGVLSDFQTSFSAATQAGIPAGGFLLLDAPIFTAGGFALAGNSSNNYVGTTFNTFVRYQNSSGGVRTLINSFVKLP